MLLSSSRAGPGGFGLRRRVVLGPSPTAVFQDSVEESPHVFQKTALPNGLRIVTASMSHTRSVAISVFVGAGSRYETDAEAGISHFVEHMLFKGTERRPTPKEISEVIEGVGGVLNGATDREMTVYWCKVARPHFPMALDVLLDALYHSRFDSAEVEKERQVIIEELNAVADSPADLVDVLIDEAVWPGHPLGRDIAGTKETVSAITRPMLLGYLARQYPPNNVVIAVAGNVTHEEVVSLVQQELREVPAGQPTAWYPVGEGNAAPRIRLATRRTEQAHVCLALPGLSSRHPDRYALDMLNVVLGEGMSSRLFLELREHRGLAYDVHSYTTHLLDCGTVTVYAGVDPKRVDAALGAVMEELQRMQDGLAEEDLRKAKELSKGRLLLRMEDTRTVASWIGGQELLMGEVLTPEDVVAAIDAVTPEDTVRVARQLFVPERLTLAVVGPFKSTRRFERVLGA
ncbi:MAG: insulinase family protein [Chloroflexi bacterium]|nr:insulinase family protein [Chloroflexota bacterium]